MRPHRLPRHNLAASRHTEAEYSYNDYGQQDYAWHSYHDPAWSTHDTHGYSNNRMSGYSDRYDVGRERGWEGDGSYGGSSSRHHHSSSTRDEYRGDGSYAERDYGDRRGYGNYSNFNNDYSEGRHFNYGSYGSNYRPTYDRNSYRRNSGEQRRRYHSSRTEYNESHTRSSEQNHTSSIANRLFQHSQDNLIQIDTARLLRERRSSRRSPSPPPMGPDEDYIKTSLEISTKAGVVGGSKDLDVDDRTVVRKLLVLDLNGTLVYRSPYRSARERLLGRGSATGGWPEDDVYARFDPSQPRPLRAIHPRPYLSSFRQYLFHPKTRRWLDTMVWSSAQPHSVNDMVTKCFGDDKGSLVAIWARDKLGLTGFDYGRKVQTTKDLNKPWNELNLTSFDPSDIANSSSSSSSGPQKRTHSAKTTLLLDDSPLKAHLQPYNHLCLKEYDSEMRQHDTAIRELTLARIRLADAIAEKKKVSEAVCEIESKDSDLNVEAAIDKADEGGVAALGTEEIQSSTHLVSQEPGEETTSRKRKRKAKKEDKKKERAEEMFRKLTDENQNAGGVYDETLLAVVGVLDTVKTESNIAAWIRAGGLIQSLDSNKGKGLEKEPSVSSRTSVDEAKRPRKRTKLSETVSSPPGHEDVSGENTGPVNRAPPTSVASGQSSSLPTTSSPIRASSPPALQNASESSSETERTGVPLDDNTPTADKGKGAEEKRLWFDHPGTIFYWASRGRTVLEAMGIEIDPGVVGPTG